MAHRVALRILASLVTLAVIAILPVASLGADAQQDLAWLNAKRASSGIPGDITLNADWSAQCAQHLAYMQATGTVSHAEDPANPSYTETGNWAGTNAVLAAGLTWTESDFIWETAPLHLAQLLAPQLAATGIADDGQSVCVTTLPGYTRAAPAVDSVVTYPGNGTGIYPSETSAEWPTTPAAALGLNGPTGPHLYVYQWGPSSADGIDAAGHLIGIAAATLTGPSGPVAARWVDAADPVVGRYLPSGSGIVIPDAPLQSNTAYTATVRFSNGVSHVWAFTTATADDGIPISDVRISTGRTARRCTGRPVGPCTKRSGGARRAVTVRGRYGSLGNEEVRIRIRNGASRLTRTGADGRFAAIIGIRPPAGGAPLTVTIDVGDNAAAYAVPLSAAYRH